MAFQYRRCDRHQSFLLPPDMADWLDPGHLAWFVIEVVDKVDTSELHRRHPRDGVGRPAYNPDMLLALLIYGYCTGQRSSRALERLCAVDIAYRVISANSAPDHTTIARFRQHHGETARRLFTDVLELAREVGAASVGVVALDGTKMGADASMKANRTREAIQAEVERIMAEAEAVDSAETGLYSDALGDELPETLRDPHSRHARLEAAQAILQRRAAEDSEPTNGERRDRARERERRAQEALERVDGEVAASAAVAAAATTMGKRRRGRPTALGGSATLARAKRRVKAATSRREKAERLCEEAGEGQRTANVTDPDSRLLSTHKGWVQGYNAQAVVNEDGIVVAADVLDEANDYRCFEPMIRDLEATLDTAGITEAVGCVIADAGYLSEHNLEMDGAPRLIATGKSHTIKREALTEGPPPEGATPLERNDWILHTAEGKAEYSKRQHMIEPVFGHTKANRGYRRFVRRGLAAVRAEWHLMMAAHDLSKLYWRRRAAVCRA